LGCALALAACHGTSREAARVPSPNPSTSLPAAVAAPPVVVSPEADAGRADAAAVDSGPVAARRAPVGLARGSGDPADDELRAGDEAYQKDDLVAARRHYTRARTLAPRDPAPRVGLLRVRLGEASVPTDYAALPGDRRVRQLLDETGAILKLKADYAPAWLEQGRLWLILGDANAALKSLERAESLEPHDAETQSALGVAWLATGKSDTALEHFRRAADLDPDDPDRLTNLGTAYLMRGLVNDAVRAFERAVVLAPADARARGDLGTAYLAANRPDQAVAVLERAVALAPDRATLLSNLGYAYQSGGKLDLAIITYQRALGRDSRLGSAWINLGTARAKQGDYAEAERCLRQALKLDPSDPRALANLEELRDLRRTGPVSSGGRATR
jgi:Flp pilus assembly protein TadD